MVNGWGAALDIEELVTLGKRDATCPYYLSRNAVPEANLVLLPYNYLLDPPTRESLKVHWPDSVIIFDEAHNLESIASDAASCELSSYDLAGAMAEVDRCIEKAQRVGYGEANDGEAGGQGSAAALTSGPTYENLLILKQVLVGIDEELDAVELPKARHFGGQQGKKSAGDGASRNGAWLLELLGRHNVNAFTAELLLAELGKAVDLLMDEHALGGPAATLRLEAVIKLFRTVFRSQSQSSSSSSSSNPFAGQAPKALTPEAVAELAERYRCHIAPLEPKGGRRKGVRKGQQGSAKRGDNYSQSRDSFPPGSSSSSCSSGGGGDGDGDGAEVGPRILSFWCFCPGIAMEELKALGVR